jgi:putative transposase
MVSHDLIGDWPIETQLGLQINLPGTGGFAWQDGYAAFTVSKSQVPEVEEYIRGQREHHRVKIFEEEYRTFLDRHEIDYDEEYVFG